MKVLIAGGTGFVGLELRKHLMAKGHIVYFLSRSPKQEYEIQWNPQNGFIADHVFNQLVDVIINLAGAGINDKRWTQRRKKELYDSRIGSNACLFSNRSLFPNLKHFISASGITAYPFDDGNHLWREDEQYGDTYIAQLVKDWEHSADMFTDYVKVAKLRIAVVLGKDGGALPVLVNLTKKSGLGGAVGSGKQIMPWVGLGDLTRLFCFVMENELEGVYNTNADNISNADLMQSLRVFFNKKFVPPTVPGFVLKLVLGSRSSLLLEGNSASNHKIIDAGFSFKYDSIDSVLDTNFPK